MLVYAGHIELPVCDWMCPGNGYVPAPKLVAIPEIKEVSPHPNPVEDSTPPYKPPCCFVQLGSGPYYCFLSYEETCRRINAKVAEMVQGIVAPSPSSTYGPIKLYSDFDWDKLDWESIREEVKLKEE